MKILNAGFFAAAMFALCQITTSTASASKANFQPANIDTFGLAGTHTIALTFDDGPGEGTVRILNLLKKYGIHATFFEIGGNIADDPTLPARIVSEGHILGNHTWTHPDLDQPAYVGHPSRVVAELKKTDTLIRKAAAGRQDHFYFRAPEGAWAAKDATILNKYSAFADYIGPIYWDVGSQIKREFIVAGKWTDAADWQCWDHKIEPSKCLTGYLNHLEKLDGGVVLSHDLYANTAEMWEQLLPTLVEKGYKFVTLDEIPALEKYRAAAKAKVEKARR